MLVRHNRGLALGPSGPNWGHGERGVWAGGRGYSPNEWTEIMDYVTIATTGNAAAFGDLDQGWTDLDGEAGYGRGFIMGGRRASPYSTAVIRYITIGTLGDSATFGTMQKDTVCYRRGQSASSGTRIVSFGGRGDNGNTDDIDYFAVDTLGNSSAYGNLIFPKEFGGATSDGSRAVVGHGGGNPNYQHDPTIEYCEIDTPADTVSFGTGFQSGEFSTTSNGTRAFWAGGYVSASPYGWPIEYTTISTPGNAADYGDITGEQGNLRGASDDSRTVAGGDAVPTHTSTCPLDYFDMNLSGPGVNSADFGDLISPGNPDVRNNCCALAGS